MKILRSFFAFFLAMLMLITNSEGIAETFGVSIGDYSAVDQDPYTNFLSYLEESTGRKHDIRFDTPEIIRTGLLLGDIHIALLSSHNYVLAKQSDTKNKIRLLGRFAKYENPFYQSSIILNRDASTSLDSLEAMTFLYSSQSSTSSYLYPLSILVEMGVDVRKIHKVQDPEGKQRILERISDDPTLFGGVSNAAFEKAAARGTMVSKLYKFMTSPDEIPYDALVVYRGDRQSEYEIAIGPFFFQESNSRFLDLLPRIEGLTGLTTASDEDYDPIRIRHTFVTGGRVLDVGLSLALEPNTRKDKLRNFRQFNLELYNKHNTFLRLRVYAADETENILDDLRNNHIDLGELPPVFSGEAISVGLKPIMIPIYENHYFEAVIIKRKGDTEIINGKDLLDKTIALGGNQAASSFVYPLRFLEEFHEISKSDLTILDGHSASEIITLVATGQADAGAIAKFRLENAMNNGHKHFVDVIAIPDAVIRIPNGGYILNQSFSGNEVASIAIRDNLSNAGGSVANKMHPSLQPIGKEDLEVMLDRWKWANPPDTRALRLVLIAIVIMAIVVIVFLRNYRPTGT